MPNRYSAKKVRTRALVLDLQNPRFVALHAVDQETVIDYLINNEGVIDLARSINAYGGLMPGEIPLVCVENDTHIVVEGNRRVCSCKLLLNPNLAPAEFRASIPTISKETRAAIRQIGIHILGSREEAQIILGTRHIQGIKKWPPVAKYMFFAHHFEAGKTIDEISTLTGVSSSTIKTALKRHYFLQFIIALDCWTDLEKQNRVNYTELHKKGVDRILRIFGTEGSSELQLTYDETFKPVSGLANFGKIVEHIVRRGLNILPGKKEITTRFTFADIRDDVREWLPETKLTRRTTEQTTRTEPHRLQEFYFENLTHGIDPKEKKDKALLVICDEIKKISKGGAFRQYPLAASYLTRALIEQTLKRHLRIHDSVNFQRLFPPNDESSLRKTLRFYCSTPALIPDINMRRLFGGLFHDGGGIKDIMDLNVHHPDLSIPTGTVLEGWVSQGLKNILEYLLQ